MNAIDLNDKMAIVTGGASGIGLAVTHRFLDSGAKVTVWDIDPDAPERMAKVYPEVMVRSVDITDADAVEAATAEMVERVGRIDILINSAGVGGVRHEVAGYPVDAWQRIMRVNLDGTFMTCRSVGKQMKAQKSGRIVNIASIAGKEGNPFGSAYSVSKAGVIALTKAMAKEFLETEVRINCVTPCAIETELFKKMSPESQAGSRSRIPIGRLGRPEEVAAMIAWLSSDECSLSTGAVFDLSGGRATY